jgi:hypothetical protein
VRVPVTATSARLRPSPRRWGFLPRRWRRHTGGSTGSPRPSFPISCQPHHPHLRDIPEVRAPPVCNSLRVVVEEFLLPCNRSEGNAHQGCWDALLWYRPGLFQCTSGWLYRPSRQIFSGPFSSPGGWAGGHTWTHCSAPPPPAPWRPPPPPRAVPRSRPRRVPPPPQKKKKKKKKKAPPPPLAASSPLRTTTTQRCRREAGSCWRPSSGSRCRCVADAEKTAARPPYHRNDLYTLSAAGCREAFCGTGRGLCQCRFRIAI